MAGGVERLGLAALDSRTGEPLDWVPRLGGAPLGSRINTIAVRGSSVFIGGEFTSVNGQARVNLAELDAHTGGLKPLDIQPDNSVRAFAIDGSTLYVGGLFHLVDPDHVQRNGIIAIDLEQGVLSSFAPAAQDETGGRIEDIAVDADTVYVSGRFDFMDGVVRHNIAAINKHTGRVTSWDPRATGPDWCTLIVVAGQTVYVAGRFGEIGGKPDRWIAAVDRTTAAVSDWNPILSEGRHFTGLVVRGQIVFLAGSFLDYDHDGVRTGLCAVDTTSGALLPWNPDPDQGVIALITTTDRLIAVGGFTKFKENPSIANHVVTFELEPPTKQVPTTGAK
jgi:hypothetical protein